MPRAGPKATKQGDCWPIALPQELVGQESDPKGRLRVSNWIVPGLDDDAVEEAIELCFLVAF